MIQGGMSMIPLEVRKRVVKAYREGKSGTYAQTAEIFGIGATRNVDIENSRKRPPSSYHKEIVSLAAPRVIARA